jgi:hypothetical protein
MRNYFHILKICLKFHSFPLNNIVQTDKKAKTAILERFVDDATILDGNHTSLLGGA